MDSTDAAAWISAGAAGLSAVAAVGAWRAGSLAGRAAAALTGIEAARRHQELMPRFEVGLKLVAPGSEKVHLDLELQEPVALQRLESLTVRIRDDRPGRADEITYPDSNNQEMMVDLIRSQVWGPFRFSPGVGPIVGTINNPADEDGRQVVVNAPLEVGEALRFQLEPTRPPWLVGPGVSVDTIIHEEDWRQGLGDRIRLTVVARAKDTDPWVIPLEVPVGKPVHSF